MGQVSVGSKLLLPLGGQTVLAHTLRAFEETPTIDEIILVANGSATLARHQHPELTSHGKRRRFVKWNLTRPHGRYVADRPLTTAR